MGITLVVNPGSSSKKFALYRDRTLLINAYVERSVDGFEMCTAISGTQQLCEQLDKGDFKDSLSNFLEIAKQNKYFAEFYEVTKVAVRVVAPGTFFQDHRLIDEDYLSRLKKLVSTVPLHIPHLLQEIESIKKFLPAAKIVAVSDSYFHRTIPVEARRYSIPEEESIKHDIYRFGYHGLSVASVMRKIKKFSQGDNAKVVVCHIGSGVSVTAVKDGKSVDTTMGYAPGSGLLMGSRAGDLEIGALLALMQFQHLRPTDAQVYLQTRGGLKGLTGESDIRLVLERRAKGDKAASEAISTFVYHIQKAIGSYVAIMGGIDTLVFTATASERSSLIRSLIAEPLAYLNISIDFDKNEQCLSRDGVLSKDGSKVNVLVVKTDEAEEILLSSLPF
jgi:acetate kinase